MSEPNTRSIRSRSPSPSSQISDLCIEDEYISKYTDPETGVTHCIYSFDEGQSIAPSSSFGEIDYETETDDENGLKEQNTEATTEVNSDENAPAYTACKDLKGEDVKITRECGCPCTCQSGRTRVDRMMYVGIAVVVLLGFIAMVIAADMKSQTTRVATEGGWENNSRPGTYFGLCGADMDPCCFDKENFVNNFREMRVQGIKLGLSKAMGCWRHMQSAK